MAVGGSGWGREEIWWGDRERSGLSGERKVGAEWKKKKEEVGKENLGEILCKKSQKFGGNKDALKMSL